MGGESYGHITQWACNQLTLCHLVSLVPGPDGEAKFFLQVSDHPTNETTAVQEERRVVGRSYRRRIRAE